MRLLLLTSLFFCFHSLSQANMITASIVTKQNSQLVMVSEFSGEWGLNQVPFNSLKNLQIKGTFMSEERAILVFDLNEAVQPAEASETHVLTSLEKLLPADLDLSANAVKVQVLENGDVMTVMTNPEKAAFVGKLSPMQSTLVGSALLWTSNGQILSVEREVVGHVIAGDAVVTMVTDLDKKIATLTGSGSEIVITGEKKEFLASMDQLQELNAEQKQNPEWVPVTDLKISNLGSVLQIEFRNSIEEESFTTFKLVSPLVVNQIKENKPKEEAPKN